MQIKYDMETKNLPIDQLHRLFLEAGWSKGDETPFMMEHFNAPFINATFVISAWCGDRLVGCVRAISDRVVRSVLQDLVVDKEYQGCGIGSTLLKKMVECCPKSEWLVPTISERIEFYKKRGFELMNGTFMYKHCDWF